MMAERTRTVIVGASGFGRECLDVMEAMILSGANINVVGVVDDAPSPKNLERLQRRNVRYIGSIQDWLDRGPLEEYLLGIGDPSVRAGLVDQLRVKGACATRAVHPNASIGTGTKIAAGVVICAGATISTNVRLDQHVQVNPNGTIGHDCIVEEFVSINPGAVVSGDVHLQRQVLVGAGATVLQGLRVGARSVVGAAALVTRDVPENVVVKGVPGRWL